MEEDLTKKPLYEIMLELSFLEQKIDLMVMKYNLLRAETIRRFPQFDSEDFKPKELKK